MTTRRVIGGSGGLSFAASTPVATPSGARAIGSLKVGDQVTAYDPRTGKSSTQTVQHVWINHDHDLLDVTLHADGQDGTATQSSTTDKAQEVATKAHGSQAPPPPSLSPSQDETIHTTEQHPWLTTDRGWVTAGDLRVGEHIVALGGHTATITALAVHPGAATYYNLTVSRLHTYAVGSHRFVVHNTGCQSYPGEGLPARGSGDPTTGRFVEKDGTFRTFVSGHSDADINLQPRRMLPDKVPGMENRVGSYDHVEAHAASYMRLQGIQDADLWINNEAGPCIGVFGCAANLPHMLSEDATLTVHWPDSSGGWVSQTYVGLPDSLFTNWKFP